MGRDIFEGEDWEEIARVSIHTPVWGVTLISRGIGDYFYVSIHTPVWGVTVALSSLRNDSRVSIHTPVWGVTQNATLE